jgi:predicted DNA-binding transcriptional regulator AlpA
MSHEQHNAETSDAYLKRVCDYDPATDKLMKTSDILEMLANANAEVSRNTFDRWVKNGSFPKPNIRIGQSWRWTERRVKEWLRSCVEKAQQ